MDVFFYLSVNTTYFSALSYTYNLTNKSACFSKRHMYFPDDIKKIS